MKLRSGDQLLSHSNVYSKKISRVNKSKKTERDQDRAKQVEESKDSAFPILIRAKSTRKSSSTHVKPEDVVGFYKEMREVMSQWMSFEGKFKLWSSRDSFTKTAVIMIL